MEKKSVSKELVLECMNELEKMEEFHRKYEMDIDYCKGFEEGMHFIVSHLKISYGVHHDKEIRYVDHSSKTQVEGIDF